MSGMIPVETATETWRKNFRSLVLLAVLGICTASAWALAWYRGAPAREAAEILAAVRRDGLRAYWTELLPRRRWFLIRQGGKIVGWEMVFRRVGPETAEGGFVQRQFHPAGQIRLASRWRIRLDAEKGEYQSQQVFLRPGGAEVNETTIELRDRRIQVLQNRDGVRFLSVAPTPDNYLPEGLMDLVIRETARRKTRTRFEMVLDSQPPARQQGAQTPLFPLEFRYLGEDPQTGGTKIEESLSRSEGTGLIVLDTFGEVIRRQYGETEYTFSSRSEVLRSFPDAAEFADEEETVEM